MQAKKRIAIGRIWQETNTFAGTTTGLREFEQYTWQVGDAMLPDLRRHDNELAGFADVLDAYEVEYVPLIAASTWCGGRALPEVMEACTNAVVSGLRRAKQVDAILLSLHGALVGVGMPDVEGHLLAAMRAVVGPGVPIVVSLDHHANVTQEIVDKCDLLTAYRDCPHTDMRETGRRAARLLWRLMTGEFTPIKSFCKIPLVTPCEQFLTAEGPMRDWFALAQQLSELPAVLDVSLFPVMPWIDVPEHGWSVVVTTDGDAELADNIAVQLAEHAWVHRHEFFVAKYEPAEAVRRAASVPGPVVIADGADATNGGSSGDSTCLLREMLVQKITCMAILTLVDAEVAALAHEMGSGQTINVDLGAKRSRRYHQPLAVTAKIANLSNGQFQLTGHLAMRVNMGRCALLEIGSIQVLVSEFAGPGHDPEVFRHIGVEPREAQIIVVKATVGHMDAYRDIMRENLPCECPGPSPSYLERLDYQQIPRPMFPFDPQMEWQPISRPAGDVAVIA